ncbi:MAG: hypothetical protein WBG86_15205 [Polyangiales bacterium]
MSGARLGTVLPGSLVNARLELHWAAQLVTSAGASLLPSVPDFSHTNLGWVESLGVLAGRPVGDRGRQAALVFEGLELVVLEGELERASLSLAGRTLEDGRAWLAGQLGVEAAALELPRHDMPPHPVGEGGVFSEGGTDERGELAAWFANATRLIGGIVEGHHHASPVRCWPHHFDVASLLSFDPDTDPEKARSVGVGFSPGDGTYAQPYFYVTPWPYPDATTLPVLSGGARWHTKGWTGAVLTGDVIVSMPHDEQRERMRAALSRALDVSRVLLSA